MLSVLALIVCINATLSHPLPPTIAAVRGPPVPPAREDMFEISVAKTTIWMTLGAVVAVIVIVMIGCVLYNMFIVVDQWPSLDIEWTVEKGVEVPYVLRNIPHPDDSTHVGPTERVRIEQVLCRADIIPNSSFKKRNGMEMQNPNTPFPTSRWVPKIIEHNSDSDDQVTDLARAAPVAKSVNHRSSAHFVIESQKRQKDIKEFEVKLEALYGLEGREWPTSKPSLSSTKKQIKTSEKKVSTGSAKSGKGGGSAPKSSPQQATGGQTGKPQTPPKQKPKSPPNESQTKDKPKTKPNDAKK